RGACYRRCAAHNSGIATMGPDVKWDTVLPPELWKMAYEAGAEFAWKRKEAIEVLNILSGNGYVVLGVGVWLATRPGPTIPTPFVYDWSLDSAASPNRKQQSATDFVRNFQWDIEDTSNQGKEPYFNITAMRRDS